MFQTSQERAREVAIIFFGIVRSVSITVESIWRNIIEPNANSGKSNANRGPSFTSFASLNIIDSIHNPRSGELGIPINRSDSLKLCADYFLLTRQDDQAIIDELHAVKGQDDVYNDNYRSSHNLLHQFASLHRAWRALELLRPDGFDAYLFLRADLCYRDPLNFRDLQQYITSQNSVLLPAWHSWGGLNDRFALAGPIAARHYALRFERVLEFCRTHPMHAETFLAWSLAQQGCSVGELPIRASRVRSNDVVKDEDFTATRLLMPRHAARFTYPPVTFLDMEQQASKQGPSVANGLCNNTVNQVPAVGSGVRDDHR